MRENSSEEKVSKVSGFGIILSCKGKLKQNPLQILAVLTGK
jgi:hypothetical protein